MLPSSRSDDEFLQRVTDGNDQRYARSWREARDKGLSGKAPGRPARSAAEVENDRLRKENDKLTAELARTKAAIEVMGKAHALLELLSGSADSGRKPPR